MGGHRVVRSSAHRELNDSIARSYGRLLRDHLRYADSSPAPAAAIHIAAAKMHDVAKATFPSAYLRGKSQAIGDFASFQIIDHLWIDRKLASNYHFLFNSLVPDMLGKINRQRLGLPGPPSTALDASFGSRVENLYGGTLWTVHEAGFRAGVDELRYMGAVTPTLYQDDSVDVSEIADHSVAGKQKTDKDYWALLALLLGFGRDGGDELRKKYASLTIGVEYITQHDDSVCASCDAAEGVYNPPEVSPLPGEVCVPGETLVSSPHILESHRRRYRGPMVSVSTLGGRNFSCTPNHPVLTRRGWVEAGKLREGDDLVCGSLGERVSNGDPDVHHIPTRIDQIHRSLLQRASREREAFVSVDLDVDIPEGKVEVITTGRGLSSNNHPALREQAGKLILPESHMGLNGLFGTSHLGQGGRGLVAATPSLVGSHGSSGEFFGAQSGVHQGRPFLGGAQDTQPFESCGDDLSINPEGMADFVDRLTVQVSGSQGIDIPRPQSRSEIRQDLTASGLSPTTNGNPGGDQTISDSTAGYAKFLSQAQLGYARGVSLDEVRDIRVEDFDGHVYNLATETHWYVVDGVILHNCDGWGNCRCYLQIVVSQQGESL